jgi:3-hydroxy-3-methylglutaryl CoA synthase
VAAAAGLKTLLNNRYKINVAQYEAMENFREQRIKEGDFTPDFDMVPGLYDEAYKGKGLLVYTGSKGFYRTYKFS